MNDSAHLKGNSTGVEQQQFYERKMFVLYFEVAALAQCKANLGVKCQTRMLAACGVALSLT